MKNSNEKGEIAQFKAQIRAIEKGFEVNVPTRPLRYDLILVKDNKFYRTQVKYCATFDHKSDKLLRLCIERTVRGKKTKPYTSKEIDLLLLYVPKIDKILAYKPKDFDNKKSLSINLSDNLENKWSWKNFIW